MSTQKGNSSRSRPQKYKNRTAFKNDLHDKSNRTKMINNLEIANVCERCKNIIEWKIKYKKYKPLKTPSKCIKCEEKTIKHAYHNICLLCAKQHNICAKCGAKGDIIETKSSEEEALKLDLELQRLLKELPERKRRSFIRYVNRNAVNKGNNSKNKNHEKSNKNQEETVEEETAEDDIGIEPVSNENLLLRLKSLIIKKDADDDFDTDNDSDTFM